MKDEEAIRLLTESLDQIDSLKASYKSSYEHTKWNLDILHLFEEIFGDKSEIYVKFNHLTW
jgi:glutaredoxin 2